MRRTRTAAPAIGPAGIDLQPGRSRRAPSPVNVPTLIEPTGGFFNILEPWRGVEWSMLYVSFVAYVFIIITYKLPIGTEAMIAALIGLMIVKHKVRTPQFVVLLGFFVVWSGLGFLQTASQDLVETAISGRAKIVLISLVAVNALRTGPQIRFFQLMYVSAFMLFPARASLLGWFKGEGVGRQAGRAIGPFIYSNSNDLAVLTILALGIAVALAVSEPKKSLSRLAAWASIGAMLILILMTQSRGAFVGIALATAPGFIHLARTKPRSMLYIVLLLGCVVAVSPGGVWKRVGDMTKLFNSETIDDADKEGSAKIRFKVIKVATNLALSHPLFGVGLGGYAEAHKAAAEEQMDAFGKHDAHNTPLRVAAETGFPGLFIFLALIFSAWRFADTVRKSCEARHPKLTMQLYWLQRGLLAYLFAGLFDSQDQLPFGYFYLALIWALAEHIRTLDGQSAPKRGLRTGLVPTQPRGDQPALAR